MIQMIDRDSKERDLRTVRRRKLVIQKKEIITDEWDNETEEWTDWKTVRAERRELYGEEYYAARQLGEENTVKWKLKWVEFVEEINTVDYRVYWPEKDKSYKITDTDHLQDDGQWIILRCQEVGNNGD